MARREKTKHASIYRLHHADCPQTGRCECPYWYRYRLWPGGPEKSGTARTLDEARADQDAKRRQASLTKAHREGLHAFATQAGCPECERARVEREAGAATLGSYSADWLERDPRVLGVREQTRDEYERLIKSYALKHVDEDGKERGYFDSATRLTALDTGAMQGFVTWLCRQPNRREKKEGNERGTLSDKSVRNVVGALGTMLAQAVREGKLPHNPCSGVKLPKAVEWDEDDEDRGEARPFPGPNGDVMEIVVSLIPPSHRLLFELLAWTGLRRSEVIALQGKDLHLDGCHPYVSVRRRLRRVKGKGLQAGPPKTKTSRRDIPIPIALADKLRALGTAPKAWVFTTNGKGTPLDPDNLHARVLRPACEEADCSWAGFHTFRHTIASRLLAEGRNVVQTSRFLGHANAHITLDVYGHLLNEDVGGPLVLTPVRDRSAAGSETLDTGESLESAQLAA